MYQIIIVAVIVAVAAGITVVRLIRYFRDPLRKCDGCGMSCNGCPLEKLKEQKKKSR